MKTLRDHAQAAAHTLADTLGEREGAHGDFGDNAVKAQGMKDHLTSIETPVLREAADAIACKLARIASGGEMHVDSWLDCAGYALLAAGYIEREREVPPGGQEYLPGPAWPALRKPEEAQEPPPREPAEHVPRMTVARGRPKPWMRGHNNAQAKMTEDKARYVLNHLDEPCTVLARRFGVSASTIKVIRRGKTWKHVYPDRPRMKLRRGQTLAQARKEAA